MRQFSVHPKAAGYQHFFDLVPTEDLRDFLHF